MQVLPEQERLTLGHCAFWLLHTPVPLVFEQIAILAQPTLVAFPEVAVFAKVNSELELIVADCPLSKALVPPVIPGVTPICVEQPGK